MTNTIIVLKESSKGEKRVALDPATAAQFSKLGFNVTITPDAGESAFFPNTAYENLNIATPKYNDNDIILSVQPPTLNQIKSFKPNSLLICLLDPYRNPKTIEALRQAKISTIALELIPRITRAQSMDVLSSQASIAGYEGTLMAASLAPRFFPMLTTAAGTIRPARVIVVGAGVAGLQAIATARRLGAQVEAYDIRSAAKEQVESLGAKLIDTGVDATGVGGYARSLTPDEEIMQAEALKSHLIKAHAVICTAAIPGRKAPIIITKEMVNHMQRGAVIVDLSAETGGNCELTEAGKTILHEGVTISGPLNVPSNCAIHASEMYAKNIYNLLSPFIADGKLEIDFSDEVIRECLVTHEGEIVSNRIKQSMEN